MYGSRRRIYGFSQAAWSACTAVLTAFVALLAVALVGVRLVGITPYAVASGSMKPNIPVGALVYTQKVSPEAIAVGDVITYERSTGGVVTHRVTKVLRTALTYSYITKGDANQTPDGAAVPYREVKGKVAFHLPYLGSLSMYLATSSGKAALAAAALVLLVAFYLLPALHRATQQVRMGAQPLPGSSEPFPAPRTRGAVPVSGKEKG